MLNTIFKYELSYWVKNPLPYIFGLFIFGISFISMWGMASEAATGAGLVIQNSVIQLHKMSHLFGMLLLFLLPAIMGVSIFRDYQSRMYTVLYSYPFTKKEYLLAKFGSSFLVVVLIVLGLGGGFILGTMMPTVKVAVLHPFDIGVYCQLYGLFILPNMLFFGSIIFAIVAFTRNIYIGFISVIVVIILQGVIGGLFGGESGQFIAALLDPTGETAVKSAIRYWTLEERNTLAIPLSMALIGNRLLYLGLSLLILYLTYRHFQFHQTAITFFESKRAKNMEEKEVIYNKVRRISLPAVDYGFSFLQQLKNAWHLSKTDFRYMVWSWQFLVLILTGFLLVLFQQYEMNPQHGIALLPTTAKMLKIPLFIFTGIINLLTFLYTGMILYRGKLSRMDSLIDSTPQANWVLLLSHLFAILKMQGILLALVMLGGLIAQTMNGYYQYEIGHYLFELFVLQFVHFLIWACMAMFVHVVVRNMYLGFFMLLLIPIVIMMLPQVGSYLGMPILGESVMHYNAVPGQFIGFEYSAFNGYGTALPSYFLYKVYWLFAALILIVGALLFWNRGVQDTWKERWELVKMCFVGATRIAFILGILGFMSLGCSIYYNDHYISKTFYTEEDEDFVRAMNEKRYGHFANTVQPKIAKVNIQMDLYPNTRDFVAKGQLSFVNKLEEEMDTILVAKSFREQTEYQIINPHTVLVEDEELHFDVIKLEKALAMGERLEMKVEVKNHPNSFLHHNSRLLSDGNYLLRHILPKLGLRNIYLSNQEKRDEYGLGVRPVPSSLPSDTSLLGYEYAPNQMDRIEFETIVSTSDEQVALSMGTLQRKWTENGRNYYHYKSEGDIVNTPVWLSGTYTKKEDSSKWQHLEIYHHPNHDHNTAHLFHGMRSSLGYCSDWFGALDFDTIKLVEFSKFVGTFATVNGNLVPYSEAQLLCNVKDHKNEKFNDPFYTTAHEIAHLWWGHRVDPAAVQGGKLLTESMAEYITLQVTKQQFGVKIARQMREKFLKNYLQLRAQASDELPLVYAKAEQDYLNYRKGALALYAISAYIGEAKLNEILADYEKTNRHAPPPYPTSLDFVAAIKAGVPDSLQYLITDYFETITLYDNQVKEVCISQPVAGNYMLEAEVLISKYRASGTGKKSYVEAGKASLQEEDMQSLPLQDYIPISVLDEEGELILTTWLKATSILNRVVLEVDRKPAQIVIDYEWLLIDADRADNRGRNCVRDSSGSLAK